MRFVRFFVVIGFCLRGVISFGFTSHLSGPPSADSLPALSTLRDIQKFYDKQEIYITMRDGIRLFTSIYTPRDQSENLPIVLVRTPYGIEPNQKEYSGLLLGMSHLLSAKYIIALQDVRGCYMSEGDWEEIRPYRPNKSGNETDESTDTFDTIDWLVKNVKHNNGKVGISGISYPGFYATMSLLCNHPALKAVSPQAPCTNWFLGDDVHHNGAFFLMDNFSFYAGGFGRPHPVPTRDSPPPFDVKANNCQAFYKTIEPLPKAANYFGDTISFWGDIMNHPNYDDFWKARNPLPYLDDVKPAVLVVGGLFDAEDLWGTLHTYKAIEDQNADVHNTLMMGPWFHHQWRLNVAESVGKVDFGANTAIHFRQEELRFFDFYLKNKGSKPLPEASVFVTGENAWHDFDAWPPRNTTGKTIYLNCNHQLSFDKPDSSECFDEYTADPANPVPYSADEDLDRTVAYMTEDQRFVDHRPDVMSYETSTLDHNMTVVGPLRVHLFVSTTGTDADFVVKLIDVFPDQGAEKMRGYEMLVRGDVMRGRFRDSFEKPEPFTPGRITEVTLDLPDIAHEFKQGHRIMVQVQNSWFPLVDLNPQKFVDIYHAADGDFTKATDRIYHDSARPSDIEFQILGN